MHAAACLLLHPTADATNAQRYGQHFTEWLAALRADLAEYHPQLPLAMAVMADWKRAGTSWGPYMSIVRQQQQALQLPGVAKADMQGVEFFREAEKPDGSYVFIHLSKYGAVALGRALAHAHYAALVAAEGSSRSAAACLQPAGDASASAQAAARTAGGGGSSAAAALDPAAPSGSSNNSDSAASAALQSRLPAASNGGSSWRRQLGAGAAQVLPLWLAASCWLVM
jgi:hypothetical protein